VELELQLTQANAKYDASLLKLSSTEGEIKHLSNDQEQKEELIKMLRTQLDKLTDENQTNLRDLDDLQVLLPIYSSVKLLFIVNLREDI
jgi:hypothetical protein